MSERTRSSSWEDLACAAMLLANATGRDDLLDWLFWPANLMLTVGATWFVSEDAVIQMVVATLVLAGVVSLIAYSQSLTDSLRSRSKAPHS
jgi:hypothetical protein